MGSGGEPECHTRMTMQERRTGTWGAAGDEDAPTGAAARKFRLLPPRINLKSFALLLS